MKTKINLITLFLFSFVVSHAETNNAYECIYEYKVNNGGAGETCSTILMFDDTSAVFYDYSSYLVDSVSVSGGTNDEIERFKRLMMKSEYFFDQTVCQNDPEGKNTVYGIITPNKFVYTEESLTIQWNLKEETDTVCGYICNKAVGEFGGRTWTAWYTSQIPVVYGPWKLCGLPGLVLKAEDSEDKLRFEAITFRKGYIQKPSLNAKECINTTKEKFIKTKNNFERNPMANIPFEAIGKVHIDKQAGGKDTILIDGMQLRIHPNGYVPLEL